LIKEGLPARCCQLANTIDVDKVDASPQHDFRSPPGRP
jgi:hypothetical protein